MSYASNRFPLTISSVQLVALIKMKEELRKPINTFPTAELFDPFLPISTFASDQFLVGILHVAHVYSCILSQGEMQTVVQLLLS